MPQQAWSAKRERQYDHIKSSEKKQGRSPKRAKQIAAATVNKERARDRFACVAADQGGGELTMLQASGSGNRRGIMGKTRQLSEVRQPRGVVPIFHVVERPRDGDVDVDAAEDLADEFVVGENDEE